MWIYVHPPTVWSNVWGQHFDDPELQTNPIIQPLLLYSPLASSVQAVHLQWSALHSLIHSFIYPRLPNSTLIHSHTHPLLQECPCAWLLYGCFSRSYWADSYIASGHWAHNSQNLSVVMLRQCNANTDIIQKPKNIFQLNTKLSVYVIHLHFVSTHASCRSF